MKLKIKHWALYDNSKPKIEMLRDCGGSLVDILRRNRWHICYRSLYVPNQILSGMDIEFNTIPTERCTCDLYKKCD